MKLRIEEEKDDPLILNLSQNLEYTDGYLMGKLLNPPEKVGEDVVRLKFEWEAIDAVTEEENDEKQKTFVLKKNVITVEAGEVSPRKIYILLPDRFTEVSDELKRGFGDNDPKQVLGLVLAKFYRSSQIIEALEMVADNEPEIMEKVGFAVSNSELDDSVKETVKDIQSDQIEMSKKMNGTLDEEI